jgi:hypothetical protein
MDQNYFVTPFASLGDQTTVPIPTDPGGSISMQQGWGPDYARDQTSDPLAKPVDRATTNYLFFIITQALAALQRTGIPEWITPANNNGTALAYPKYAQVRYSATTPGVAFETYVSVIDNNTSVPGADANWQPIASIVAQNADVVAGTSQRLPVTPLTLKAYPGNSAQVFSVGQATSANHAVRFSQLTGVVGVSRSVSGAQTTAAATFTVSVGEIQLETAGGLRFTASPNNSFTFNGATTGANGMDTGAIPASGFLAIYAIFNPVTSVFALLGVNATAAAVTEVYTGLNMPSGFTASALMFVVPTTAASLVGICVVRNRRTSVVQTPMFSTTATAATPTIANNVGAPLNAKRCSGFIQIGNSGVSSTSMALFANSSGVGGKTLASTLNASSVASPFDDLEIMTGQRVFYTATNSGGSPTFSASMSSWEI